MTRAVVRLRPLEPNESAERTLSRAQAVALAAILVATGAALVLAPLGTLVIANALAMSFYLAYSVHRLRIVSLSLTRPRDPGSAFALSDAELPSYTILVPLFREAEVLPRLLAGLVDLDYPRDRLEVYLLLEDDDVETRSAIDNVVLPPFVNAVVVPRGSPRTKPRACNYGLTRARGELVVVYDAEDVPEPDQLRKAAAVLHDADASVACVQAKLDYYNPDQNSLTRWFTAEYAAWFDVVLPGLDAAESPVPLGGTSNHFRRDVLLEVGGWDPHNVTEDADLGVRLHRFGYRTRIVDSTTFEEANSRLGNWIRQRSRWVKGYVQTWLVQMRRPVLLWRALGTRGFVSFNLVIGGTALALLLNPFYWILTGVWLLAQPELIEHAFPGPVFFAGAISLFFSTFAFVYVAVAGCMRRGRYRLVKYALLSPPYWVLMSIAAWKGVVQLIGRPHYWEKTVHGLWSPAGEGP